MELHALQDNLKLIKNWKDPWPDPVIIKYNDIYVLRDDLIEYGSKVRFLDYFVKSLSPDIKEIVYCSPATGYAQISLPVVCKKYNKKAILFSAKRDLNNLHEYQKKGLSEGAEYKWIKNGRLAVTKSHSKKYVNDYPHERIELPLGLEHPLVLSSIIKVAKECINFKPSEIWTVVGSGTINRGLQMAFPDVPVHAVQVGHKLTERELRRAKLWVSPYKFDIPVKQEDAPPFPSAPTYDAKAWPFIKEHAKPQSLFWNIGG